MILNKFSKFKKKDQLWIVDACQHIPVIPLNMHESCADMIFFSMHKAYGPYGVAPLIVNKKDSENVLFCEDMKCMGNNILQKTFCGSLNIPEIYVAHHILEWIEKNIYEKQIYKKYQEYSLNIKNNLLENNFNIISSCNSYNIVTGIPENIHAHDYAEQLSKKDIWVRSGNLCADTWFEYHKLAPAIRFSIGYYNDLDDCRYPKIYFGFSPFPK